MYEDFLGDGDSVTFKRVREAQPYAEHNIEVKKKECVGHVGKRMGGRLRALLKKKTKGLGGRGKFTRKEVDKLSSYYGKAVRDNKEDPLKMRDAIWAFYHRASSDTKPQHHLCPPGEDSCCKWQRAQA